MEHPWEMTFHEFCKYLVGGRLHQHTGKQFPGEDTAESCLRLGELNGYSEQDIAYFYATRHPGHAGYQEYVEDAIFEGKAVPDDVMFKATAIATRKWKSMNACQKAVTKDYAKESPPG